MHDEIVWYRVVRKSKKGNGQKYVILSENYEIFHGSKLKGECTISKGGEYYIRHRNSAAQSQRVILPRPSHGLAFLE